MSVSYLEKLNPEQRRAVEHGVRENDAAPGTPLLVIAGAGSGSPARSASILLSPFMIARTRPI